MWIIRSINQSNDKSMSLLASGKVYVDHQKHQSEQRQINVAPRVWEDLCGSSEASIRATTNQCRSSRLGRSMWIIRSINQSNDKSMSLLASGKENVDHQKHQS